jgi:glycosyltransferase involved in cell wall biosynthesis
VLFLADEDAWQAMWAWFRCFLPAEAGDHDIGVAISPSLQTTLGLWDAWLLPRSYRQIDVDSYDIIVLGMPIRAYPAWERWVEERQQRGVVVFIEVDDHLAAEDTEISFEAEDGYADRRAAWYSLMAIADGVITATEFNRAHLAACANPNTFLAQNVLDTKRWGPSPDRGRPVRIGWHGNVFQHATTMRGWMPAVSSVLERHDDVEFYAIGNGAYAEELAERFGDRCRGFPPLPIERYREELGRMDIILAPVAHTDEFRGKPDQRWLTGAASGAAVVADPWTYTDVRDGETGLLASTPEEAEAQIERLIANPALRRRIGRQALKDVRKRRDASVGVQQWHRAFAAVSARSAVEVAS